MALKIGDAVPDFTFLRPDGSPLRLNEVATRPLLLIFLRHLA
jgi:peroxiredoxin